MIYLEIVVVIVLVLVNGLLAMAELAIVSSRRPRLQAMADRNVPGSRRALALAADPGRFLSTVQIGITLVGVLSGAFSGATIGLRLTAWLAGLGMSAAVAEPLGVGFVVAVITYVSLIAGELVPKRIALSNPEMIAVRVAPWMTALARAGAPVVWTLDASGGAILRLLGFGREPAKTVTNEEIRMLIAEAESAGVIEPDERSMITRVMRLGDRPVKAVMTPRRKVDMLDLSDAPENVRKSITSSIHSRLPVHRGDADELLGLVYAKDLLDIYLERGQPYIDAHIRTVPAVPDTADALDVVDIIRTSPAHMVFVHDEYGHFEGVVTNADILEAIIGASDSDEGPPEPDLVRRDDGSWLISGSALADEITETLGIEMPTDRAYETVAGYVLDRVGHLPKIGESFEDRGWRFEIIDLDGRRIDKVLARRI